MAEQQQTTRLAKLKAGEWCDCRAVRGAGMFRKKENAKMGKAQTRVKTQSWRPIYLRDLERKCKEFLFFVCSLNGEWEGK